MIIKHYVSGMSLSYYHVKFWLSVCEIKCFIAIYVFDKDN